MSDSQNTRLAELEAEILALKSELLHAQKVASVGMLATSITHEFNNILMTVINYAKMGIRHKDPATREKAFDKILAAGQRASKITTGMLSYARRQADRREPTDLVNLLEDVLVLVEKDLQMHRVRVETRYEQKPQANINTSQIQQVVLNLIVNARQAMANGGSLIVTVRSNIAEGFGEISIRDTGCGIPAEQLKEIFKPYYSTKTRDSQGQGGTGLGLALAREVMESHGGRIRVESAPGKGTAFTLKLPLAGVSPAVVPVAPLPPIPTPVV